MSHSQKNPDPAKVFSEAVEIPRRTAAFEYVAFIHEVCKVGNPSRGMDVAQVVDDHLVATDGRRLHAVRLDRLEPYTYLFDRSDDVVYEMTKRTGGGYLLMKRGRGQGLRRGPNISKLISQYDKPKWIGRVWLPKSGSAFSASLQTIMFSFPQPTGLNPEFFKKVPGGEYRVEWWRPSRGVIFRTDAVYFLVMPLSVYIQEWPKNLEAAS